MVAESSKPVTVPDEAELPSLIAAARRRRIVWIPLFLIVLAGSVVLAFTLPPVYLSTATILVEVQEISNDTVSSSVGGYVETRLGALDQRIQASDSLLQIIKKHQVYPELEQAGAESEMVDLMRASLVRQSSMINVMGPSGRPGMTTVSFSVSFEHEIPEIAQKVTNEVAELYLAENTRIRLEQASEVTQFLSDEAERLTSELNDIERRIADFKSTHMNALPEQADANRRLLENAESGRTRLEQRIQALDEQRRDLETRVQLDSAGRLTVGELLSMRRSELTQAESRYSPLHPDVKRLRKEVAELESQMNEPGKLVVVDAEATPLSNSRANLVLQAQLEEVKTNLRIESASLAELEGKVAEYEASLVAAPGVERDYQQLEFERENVFSALRTIKQKLLDAEIAVQLERESKAERYTIVQPATLPVEPIRPNRFGLVLFGLVLAIGTSVGVVTLLEILDTSVQGEKGIESILRVPPIASIPVIPG